MSDLNVAESRRHSNRVTFYAFLLETKRSCRTQRMEKESTDHYLYIPTLAMQRRLVKEVYAYASRKSSME